MASLSIPFSGALRKQWGQDACHPIVGNPGANDTFRCYRSDYPHCVPKGYLCNGSAQCPHAEDEDFEMCSEGGSFSPLATKECLPKNTFNLNFSIKAVRCDGIIECALGEDEEDCDPPSSAYYIFGITLLLIFSLATLVILFTVRQLHPIDEEQKVLKDDIGNHHQTHALKTALWQTQNCSGQTSILGQLTEMEMSKHNGIISEVFCCIKVCTFILHISLMCM